MGKVRAPRVYSGVPGWVFVPAVVGALFVVLPLGALTTRVDWPRFGALISSESSVAALRLSLQTSSAATLVCLALGVPMRWCSPGSSSPASR